MLTWTRAAGLWLLVASSATSAGCLGVGMGNMAPGMRPVKRAGGRWHDVGGGREQWRGEAGHGTKGAFGGVVAGRFGLGKIAVGDRPVLEDGGAADLRLELGFMPTTRLGLTASAGWQIEGAGAGADHVSRMGFPLAVNAVAVPVAPFVVRAGGFVEPGTTLVDDLASKGLGWGASLGGGILVQFVAWHFIVTVDWEREWIADVATADGPAAYVSDFFLIDLLVIGW